MSEPGSPPAPAREPGTADHDRSGVLLRVEDLRVHYRVRSRLARVAHLVRAVDGVSFDVHASETLGLVGESGSGKSTVARAVTRLVPATSGTVTFDGRDLLAAEGERLRQLRRDVQIIFQHPARSLNPTMTIDTVVAEPLLVHGLVRSRAEALEQSRELLVRCGIGPEMHGRLPRQLSGGQQQRVAIARALALRPRLIVADEPTSALDVSVQATLLNLMKDLQEEFRLSYLIISHDLAVVRHMASRIAVMYAGKLLEIGDATAVSERPLNPYTEALLSASPIPDPDVEARRRPILLDGEIPDPLSPPPGCRFHTRCPLVEERCRLEEPPLTAAGREHASACWVR